MGAPELDEWMESVAAKIKVPTSKWSLLFIADCMFVVDLWIKTGQGLNPHPDTKLDLVMEKYLKMLVHYPSDGKNKLVAPKAARCLAGTSSA